MAVGVDEEAKEAEEMEEVEEVDEEAEVEEWWRPGEIACSLSGSKVLPQKGHLGGGSGTFSTLAWRRATEATASLQAAQAALRTAKQRPAPSDGPGAMGRHPQAVVGDVSHRLAHGTSAAASHAL